MTDKELDKEILKYFWPHPFSGSGKPVYVAIIGEDDKVFQIPWHVFNTAIQSLITKARIDELKTFKTLGTGTFHPKGGFNFVHAYGVDQITLDKRMEELTK